jgi:hypothetical protein
MLADEHIELGPREDNRTGGKNKDFIVSTNIFFEKQKTQIFSAPIGVFPLRKKIKNIENPIIIP